MTQSDVFAGAGDLSTTERTRPRAVARGIPREAAIPSEPLLGVLPIRRVIPQDVHSVLDYSDGLMVAWAGLSARRREARIAGAFLGASIVSVSLLTDYRLSLAKLIPIEVHEALDYAWSASAIAAPFVLGYARRSPLAALVHVATGAATLLGSLFTDYRAVEGVGRKRAA